MYNEYSPLKDLIDAARAVYAAHGDMSPSICLLDTALSAIDEDIRVSQQAQDIIKEARAIYMGGKEKSDDIVIDQLPIVSQGIDGSFVSAWLFVPNPNEGMSSDDEPRSLREKLEEVYSDNATRHDGSWIDLSFLPRHDWQNEVANGETTRGYWEWVESEVEQRKNDAENAGFTVDEDSDQPGMFYFKSPEGNGSDISYATEEEAWCEAYLLI